MLGNKNKIVSISSQKMKRAQQVSIDQYQDLKQPVPNISILKKCTASIKSRNNNEKSFKNLSMNSALSHRRSSNNTSDMNNKHDKQTKFLNKKPLIFDLSSQDGGTRQKMSAKNQRSTLKQIKSKPVGRSRFPKKTFEPYNFNSSLNI